MLSVIAIQNRISLGTYSAHEIGSRSQRSGNERRNSAHTRDPYGPARSVAAWRTDSFCGRWRVGPSRVFSWFGIYPVESEGSLRTNVNLSNIGVEVVISTLEAVLIEGLEPRQNRRRGDDFQAIEFLQSEDPEIELSRKHALLTDLAAKCRNLTTDCPSSSKISRQICCLVLIVSVAASSKPPALISVNRNCMLSGIEWRVRPAISIQP